MRKIGIFHFPLAAANNKQPEGHSGSSRGGKGAEGQVASWGQHENSENHVSLCALQSTIYFRLQSSDFGGGDLSNVFQDGIGNVQQQLLLQQQQK